MIEIKDVSYKYGDIPIIENFSLFIEKGSFFMILGRNGSGKSTLAKLISGIDIPKTGKILVDKLDTSTDDIWQIRERLGVNYE